MAQILKHHVKLQLLVGPLMFFLKIIIVEFLKKLTEQDKVLYKKLSGLIFKRNFPCCQDLLKF